MAFFGITLYGPQNYVGDLVKGEYKEPRSKEEVRPLMEYIIKNSTCPDFIKRFEPNTNQLNGFAYGSLERFLASKFKFVRKAVAPFDIYRLPPTESFKYGWFLSDPDLKNNKWHILNPEDRRPLLKLSINHFF